MTRHRLLVLVGWAITYMLALAAGTATTIARSAADSRWPDTVKAVLPILIAIPAAIVAYWFAVRQHFIREFGETRRATYEALDKMTTEIAGDLPDPAALTRALVAGADVVVRLKEADAPRSVYGKLSAAVVALSELSDGRRAAAVAYPMIFNTHTNQMTQPMRRCFAELSAEKGRLAQVVAELQIATAGMICP